jgi:hypothetical protein
MQRHVKGGLAAHNYRGLLAVALLASLACEDKTSGGTGGTGGTTLTGGSGGRGGSGGSTGGSAGTGTGGSAGAGTGGATGGSGGGSSGTGGAAGSGGSAGSSGGSSGTGGATGGAGGATGGAGGSAGDAAGPAAGPERFVGRWNYTMGEEKLECPGAAPLTGTLDAAYLIFQAGAGVAPLILASPGCNLRFDIQGQTAVVQPDQTCTNAIGGKRAMFKPTMFTFALEEQVARQEASWTVIFTDTPNMPCTLTGRGILAKP